MRASGRHSRGRQSTGEPEADRSNEERSRPLHPRPTPPAPQDIAKAPSPLGAPTDEALTALARAGKHIVWTMPPDGVITDPIPAWCVFTGQIPEQARGEGWADAVHPDDRAALLSAISAGIAAQQPYEVECRLRRADGVWRRMIVHGTPVRGADGSLREWVGTCTDVTEERAAQLRAEEALAAAEQAREVAERALAARRESEAHFERLVAANLIGVVVAEDDRILDANDAFLRLVGYTRTDLEAGQVRWREMTPPEYLPLDARALAELMDRGECTPFEKAYWRKDGSQVPILLGATVLKRAPLRWVAFIVDLSAHKQLEDRLRHANEQLVLAWNAAEDRAGALEATFEAITDAVLLTNPDGYILQANAAYHALYGTAARPDYLACSGEERARIVAMRDIQGRPLVRDDLPFQRVPRGALGTTAQPQEIQLRTLDGREVVLSVTGGPLHDHAGQLTGVVLVQRDVTERRRMEEQQRFQASMLERTHDAIFVWELGGPIVFWNRGAELLYGYRADEALGRVTHDLLRTCLPELVEAFDARLLHDGEWSGELTHTTRDGQTVEVLTRMQVLRAHGAPSAAPTGGLGEERVYVLETARDITDRNRLERERAELLGLVAHDLGNPLAATKARVQLLSRKFARGDALPPDALDPISHTIDRMERLVGDLRAMEGVEAGGPALVRARGDLARLCREEAESAHLASGRIIALTLPSEPVMVAMDRDRIGQVLANLLSNALKYSPAGRPVVLSLACEAGAGTGQAQARVSVRDEGPGIPPEALPRLFGRFYRVPGIEVQHGPGRGLGLGLYLSRHLVERHGGRIGVESTVGHGSTFWFTLPLAPVDEDEVEALRD